MFFFFQDTKMTDYRWSEKTESRIYLHREVLRLQLALNLQFPKVENNDVSTTVQGSVLRYHNVRGLHVCRQVHSLKQRFIL